MTTVSKSIPSIITLDFNWDLKYVGNKVAGPAKNTLINVFQTIRIEGIKSDKAIPWAEELNETGKLRLDKSDYKTIKNWLIDDKNQNIIPIATERFKQFFEEFEKENKSN